MNELVPRPAPFRLPWRRGASTARGTSRMALAVLPVIGLLLANLLPQQGAHVDGHSLSLLAVFAAVGYAGYLTAHLHRRYGALISACSVLARLLSAASVFGNDGLDGKGYCPPRIVYVFWFFSFFVLFSGLGGWVGPRVPRSFRTGMQSVVA